jgi:RecB family endonuclease NucS
VARLSRATIRDIEVGELGPNIEGVSGTVGSDEASVTALAPFALEAQLRDFIASNLGQIVIGGNRFHLYTDPVGRGGKEYPTAIGPIDILALDDSGNFAVIELKLGRGLDRALGQLTRYMGWVKANLAATREVAGVVVARSIDYRLRLATSVIPGVALLEYEVNFRVREVGLGES